MKRFLNALVLAAFAFAANAAVDANKASQPELETVKGIGPGLSGKILAARKNGDFKNWEDLVERVGGIGPGNAARFSQAGLTVAGADYRASTAGDVKPIRADKSGKPGKPASAAVPKPASGEISR
jgi:competence protein ComEA